MYIKQQLLAPITAIACSGSPVCLTQFESVVNSLLTLYQHCKLSQLGAEDPTAGASSILLSSQSGDHTTW